MTESLGALQRRFTKTFAQWVLAVYERGYELTYGEAYRTDEQAEINAMGKDGRAELVAYLMPEFPDLAREIANNVGSGIRGSLHESRLAVDVNLFFEGKWVSDGTSPHWKLVGELWEQMGGTWGGTFGDANHLSFAWGGRK